MEILRLYLGEITGLVLVLVSIFAAAAGAPRYYTNRTMIRNMRNVLVAVAVAAFVASLTFSITVNQVPRGRVDRTPVDQDQRAFEQRHSEAK